ncbi:uncharacterized protein C14orf119-like [Tachypleus tridentatus]|uniref:uncharacterized protein C14orf119-like n=1 Tax=Tachypleus tridentatus TaxID=6853 RepID=UPI003FD3F489
MKERFNWLRNKITMSVSPQEIELRCVLHWFTLWTESQKTEFLELLLDKALPLNTGNISYRLEALTVQENSPSIFRCQLKLFSSWFDEWTDRERDNLLRKLQEKDTTFVETFYCLSSSLYTCNDQ